MDATSVDIFVLNYNGRGLLAECLPSIVRAAAASGHACRVVVIDNASTDDSVEFVAREFPHVELLRLPNDGLCSFNTALTQSSARAALLLNNDVKANEDAIDPLVDALYDRELIEAPDPAAEPIFMTAPRCTLFDGRTHEGLQTSIGWRFGLVRATAAFDGAEEAAARPGPTASAGAVLAVDRKKFLALGGFDPAYLPGRIEDLDFAYRGFLAGYQARYVPQSLFLHRGAATFEPAFGRRGNERLALRNTLLFQWTHLRHPLHVAQQCIWLPLRIVRDVMEAPFVAAHEQFTFLRTLRAAWTLYRTQPPRPAANHDPHREREFFRRHAPQRLAAATDDRRQIDAWRRDEAARDARYPLSRWYLRPMALRTAEMLSARGVRPWQVTSLGLAPAVVAALCLAIGPAGYLFAGLMVLASWFCDRTDGPLARLSGRATTWGAWFDANVDECVDLGLHVAAAYAAARDAASSWAWFWLIGFLVGKYLLVHGLATDDELTHRRSGTSGDAADEPALGLRYLYHLPGNADLRMHGLALAAMTGCLTLELALTALYFNLRWAARYVLLAARVRTPVRVEVAR